MKKLIEWRVLVYKESASRQGEWWIAQCLEHDITAKSKTEDDLADEFFKVLYLEFCNAFTRGKNLATAEDRQVAPVRFTREFERAASLNDEVTWELSFSCSPKDEKTLIKIIVAYT